MKRNIQIPPKYYGYKGGFSKITKCTNCGSTGLREDQHVIDPCKNCGKRVKEVGAGRWVVKRKITTEVHKFLWIFSYKTTSDVIVDKFWQTPEEYDKEINPENYI